MPLLRLYYTCWRRQKCSGCKEDCQRLMWDQCEHQVRAVRGEKHSRTTCTRPASTAVHVACYCRPRNLRICAMALLDVSRESRESTAAAATRNLCELGRRCSNGPASGTSGRREKFMIRPTRDPCTMSRPSHPHVFVGGCWVEGLRRNTCGESLVTYVWMCARLVGYRRSHLIAPQRVCSVGLFGGLF